MALDRVPPVLPRGTVQSRRRPILASNLPHSYSFLLLLDAFGAFPTFPGSRTSDGYRIPTSMSAYEDALRDVHQLLHPPSVKYPYWESEVANRKLFYVRGFTWFRREILRNVTDLNNPEFVRGMYDLLDERPSWLAEPYPWTDAYGWKQAYHASQRYKRTEQVDLEEGAFRNRKSQTNTCVLKFHKAAQTILFCEAAARCLDKNAEAVYEHMYIQPACAYIHGFSSAVLESLQQTNPAFMHELRAATGQKNARVFEDMARYRFLVTYQLATRTHAFISSRLQYALGDVDVRLNGNYQEQPSIYENIEVDESDSALLPIPKEQQQSRQARAK
jgi:hypothetical protein